MLQCQKQKLEKKFPSMVPVKMITFARKQFKIVSTTILDTTELGIPLCFTLQKLRLEQCRLQFHSLNGNNKLLSVQIIWLKM